jgi:hypothetical protein
MYTPDKTNSRKSYPTKNVVTAEKQIQKQTSLMSFDKVDSSAKKGSVVEDNCDESLSNSNNYGTGKPTEYSASVDQLPTTQRDDSRDAY